MTRRVDFDSFYTCAHPREFTIDWRSLYRQAEERTDEIRRQVRHELDVPYGAHPKQTLDFYYPDRETPGGWPVFLFLHGGGFREGDPALYGYLAKPFVDSGIVLALAGYRLTPECWLPDTARDIDSAVAWLQANLAARGADSRRLYLGGHSAGAILTGLVGVKPGSTGRALKGIVPVSGIFDSGAERPEYVAAGSDPAASSAIALIETLPGHTIIAWGTAEKPEFGTSARAFAAALEAKGASFELLPLEGMDHKDSVNTLADENGLLFQAIQRMILAPA